VTTSKFDVVHQNILLKNVLHNNIYMLNMQINVISNKMENINLAVQDLLL